MNALYCLSLEGPSYPLIFVQSQFTQIKVANLQPQAEMR